MSSCTPDAGTIANIGIRLADTILGKAGTGLPDIRPQSATLTLPPIMEQTRVSGLGGEVQHKRGVAGGTFVFDTYINYGNPQAGIDALKAFESSILPVIFTLETATPLPGTPNTSPVNAFWVAMHGLPEGGTLNQGYNFQVSSMVNGCVEKLSALPAAAGAVTPTPTSLAVNLDWPADTELLVENVVSNPNDTPYRVVGYKVEWKLAADTDYQVAPADFDISGATTPLVLDWKDLAGTLHVLNPGTGTISIDFVTLADTYDFRITPIDHWLLEGTPAEALGVVVPA